MPEAYLPSPATSSWHLGPIPVRGYALCVIAGVVVALLLTERRYRRMGGRPGLILDMATVTVPAGLVGARLYSVVADYHAYFGSDRDWLDIFRIWQGGLGITGAVAAGGLATWAYCRRAGVPLAPVAGAAAPAVAVGQAIGTWGNWFTQQFFGRPSGTWWAVAIAPEHRVTGYEAFATFQPVFLYECLWDLAVAVAVSWAIRRFALAGDRAFALYAALYAIGRFCTEALRIDYSPRLFGFRANQVAMLVVLAAAVAYLYGSRSGRLTGGIAAVGPAAVSPSVEVGQREAPPESGTRAAPHTEQRSVPRGRPDAAPGSHPRPV